MNASSAAVVFRHRRYTAPSARHTSFASLEMCRHSRSGTGGSSREAGHGAPAGAAPAACAPSNREDAAPLLSPDTSRLVLFMLVPCTANQFTAPSAAPPSDCSRSWICVPYVCVCKKRRQRNIDPQ